jgi:hypothetical protein
MIAASYILAPRLSFFLFNVTHLATTISEPSWRLCCVYAPVVVFTKLTNALQILQHWKLTVWKRGFQLHQSLRMGLRSIGLCELLVLFEQTKLLCIDFQARYIYGGALWRPVITASSFAPTVHSFLTSPSPLSNIASFASLYYRLLTPPPLPQFQQFTHPDTPAHNAKYPTHMNVVVASLNCLQKSYEFGEKYVIMFWLGTKTTA